MSEVSTTQLSSKGQVVIPEEVRERLGLKPGSRFVVVAEKGVIIFKVIQAPDLGEFDGLISKAKTAAKRAGMKQKDVADAIRRVRGEGKKSQHGRGAA